MGEYKTLFLICMRLFWSGIRKDMKEWVKKCVHCYAYNIWRNRKNGSYFCWSVTVLFYIMHVNFWIPGRRIDDKVQTFQSMNNMCDLYTMFHLKNCAQNVI